MSSQKMQIVGTPLMLGSFLAAYSTYKGFLSLLRKFGLMLPDPLASPIPGVGTWLIIGACVLVYGTAGVFAYRRLGNVRLKPSNARDKTSRLIRRIKKKRGWRLEIGIFVIHCENAFWREIVQLCLARASVAVIDVTELSENVMWELETAFRLMPPEPIVLACGIGENTSQEPLDQVRAQLLNRVSVSAITRAQTFFYPLHGSAQYVWGRSKALSSELQDRLASGIVYWLRSSGSHEDPI